MLSDDAQLRSRSSSPSAHSDLSASSYASSSSGAVTCLICLKRVHAEEKAVLPDCLHSSFCVPCITRWAEIKRQCPLCKVAIGSYILIQVRSDTDYLRHFLRPVTAAQPDELLIRAARQSASHSSHRRRHLTPRRRQKEWRQGTERRREAELLAMDRAVATRRMVYRYRLYALHIGSNSSSHYRAPLTPSEFSASLEEQRRLTSYVRRELWAWPNLDIEFLTIYVSSIMKSLDLRSDGAIRLLSDFLGPEGAHHFAHEVSAFMRSPFRRSGQRGLEEYDRSVRYQLPEVLRQRLERSREIIDRARNGLLRGEAQQLRGSHSQSQNANEDSLQFQDAAPASRHVDRHHAPTAPVSRAMLTDIKPEMPGEATQRDGSVSPPSVPPPREEIVALRSRLLARLEEEREQSASRQTRDIQIATVEQLTPPFASEESGVPSIACRLVGQGEARPGMSGPEHPTPADRRADLLARLLHERKALRVE